MLRKKYCGTSAYNVGIITEKLSSRIRINGREFGKGSKGRKIFIFISKIRLFQG
jgi:hypothetical protein